MEQTDAGCVNGPLPGRCAFFVTKKRRFCKMIVGRGKAFCGEHANVEQGGDRLRIPCPLDPKHTVFEDILVKHLKKCNSREKPKPVYYVQDINAGPQDDGDSVGGEVSLAERSKAELDLLIHKLKKAVHGLHYEHEERILSHPAFNDALSDPRNGDFAVKHLKQQASILGNMKALGLLEEGRCFVEFGAGRGKLSHWIHEALQGFHNTHFLLVERASTRFKVDGKHKNNLSTFERLHIDIQHLSLGKVTFLREKKLPVVGVGKHLCGAATDLALRCLIESQNSEEAPEPPRKRLKSACEPGPHPPTQHTGTELVASGVAIALCCHHRCEWRHYVGKDFFQEKGLGAAEFTAFQRMSSWATCGSGKTGGVCSDTTEASEHQEQEEHEAEGETMPRSMDEVVSAEDREHVGRLCKFLIDFGRVHYLQCRGFSSNLLCYVSKDISLENVLLTAVPSSIMG